MYEMEKLIGTITIDNIYRKTQGRFYEDFCFPFLSINIQAEWKQLG